MSGVWNRISQIGISPETDEFERRTVPIVNRICVVLWVIISNAILINFLLKTFFFIPFLLVALFLVSLSFFLNYQKTFLLSKINLMITIVALLDVISFKGGPGSGIEFYFLSLTVLPLILFKEKGLIYFFQFLCIGFLILQKFYVSVPVMGNAGNIVLEVFYIFNSFNSSLLIILTLLFFKNINTQNEELLKANNRTIEEKNFQLEAANKELDSFTYSVSHDLRAPLRAIDGFSSIIERKHSINMDADGKELFSLVKENVVKMNKLIDDLLLFSKLGKQELKISPINMTALVEEKVNEMEDKISPNVQINIMPLLPANADYDMMNQVILNLLSNAIKYSGKNENPVIEVGSYSRDNDNIYYVKDNGAGFDMQYAQRLFNPFQRLHSAKDYEGTGVGLSIVRNIINRHKGKVWAEGKVNEGATFYFSLPKEVKPF